MYAQRGARRRRWAAWASRRGAAARRTDRHSSPTPAPYGGCAPVRTARVLSVRRLVLRPRPRHPSRRRPRQVARRGRRVGDARCARGARAPLAPPTVLLPPPPDAAAAARRDAMVHGAATVIALLAAGVLSERRRCCCDELRLAMKAQKKVVLAYDATRHATKEEALDAALSGCRRRCASELLANEAVPLYADRGQARAAAAHLLAAHLAPFRGAVPPPRRTAPSRCRRMTCSGAARPEVERRRRRAPGPDALARGAPGAHAVRARAPAVGVAADHDRGGRSVGRHQKYDLERATRAPPSPPTCRARRRRRRSTRAPHGVRARRRGGCAAPAAGGTPDGASHSSIVRRRRGRRRRSWRRLCLAISGAEPWTGVEEATVLTRVGSKFAEGLRPSEPVTAPERSVRMSPKRFEATTTSNDSGRRTKFMQHASTCCTSTSIPVQSSSASTSSHIAIP